MKHPYIYDENLNVWALQNAPTFRYSDGVEVEMRILEGIRNASDRSVGSEELKQTITDWPTEYHLSAVRNNLLRPFQFTSSDRILELGSGCGAITRQFGEYGATVVAVEGSPMRAAITAERCRDLSNVTVVCDNISSLKLDEKFDVVTLIGVLEYSNLFISSDDPIRACLRIASSYLNDGGILVVAIENQLGLKYFNNCDEDHVGRPYFGINDLYNGQSPITFGRMELERVLRDSEFSDVNFYYPFPDYKVPTTVFSEAGLNRLDFKPADILFRTHSRNYSGPTIKNFNESLTYRALQRNFLLRDLSNSFLAIASKCPIPERYRSDWLAKHYNLSRKHSANVETSFVSRGEELFVVKKRMSPTLQTEPHGDFSHVLREVPYVSGSLYFTRLNALVADELDVDRVSEWARRWLAFLTEQAGLPQEWQGETLKNAYIPGRLIDCTPFNMIEQAEGVFSYVDDEWEYNGDVPLKWVMIRGMVISFGLCASLSYTGPIKELVSRVLAQIGLEVTDADFDTSIGWEDRLREFANGPGSSFADDLARVPVGELTLARLLSDAKTELEDLRRRVAASEARLDEIETSRIWRATRPLVRVVSKIKSRSR